MKKPRTRAHKLVETVHYLPTVTLFWFHYIAPLQNSVARPPITRSFFFLIIIIAVGVRSTREEEWRALLKRKRKQNKKEDNINFDHEKNKRMKIHAPFLPAETQKADNQKNEREDGERRRKET
ncbi:hypothetical protein, unlikely [Trypanosoma brucei gambiense DAL972]|uniref:Uncharacterized protein n=1 Tax=Trypanosoma brucei gambiense (strain MHOM/CI/86/DAL972) TaxID=679716 RepID=C9ZNX8_TRYB9|nr:hypothetical protein, unlikely [Trypanosoma brucei gambiense DAL972]CBH11106.1 hypothetical protein, unlikely [Trypanosoma brucei gambiense DAL972]|eukprot:XP_011773393.1 hypothetical protein, unlikely [Trypanosoma brucei gambiense DAL972]